MASLWFNSALLPGGWANSVRVTAENGAITEVASGAAPAPTDERYACAIPGFSNVHSHAFQRGMAGLTERLSANDGDSFWTWREVMYRFLGRLTPEDVEAISAQAYVEMLEAGFTRVGEFHYLHHDPSGRPYADPSEMAARVAAAASDTGIGLTLLPVFYAHSDFGGAPPAQGQRRFITDTENFQRLHESSARHLEADAVLGLAIHSLRAATPEEIKTILANLTAQPIHIHAAEQTLEVEASIAHLGARPVEWLLHNACLDARWCIVHATHMTAQETGALAACGAVAGLCPITEANLGDGVFPSARFLAAGGRIGIGTDSNILIDAAGELRSLEYAQRLFARARALLADRNVTSVGRYLVERALAGGAQATGIGSAIAPGHPADIVALDTEHPALAGRAGDLLLDSWVFAARGGAVDAVWRRGIKLVSGKRHRHAERIAGRYRAVIARLLAN